MFREYDMAAAEMYSEYFGIKVCGEYLDDNSFYVDYFFPVFLGREASTDEQIDTYFIFAMISYL